MWLYYLYKNKTENLFSPYPRSESEYQLVHKAQNRNVLLLAGKAYNKLPAYGRKKACNPAGAAYGRLLRL
jgi:hypothetical protein